MVSCEDVLEYSVADWSSYSGDFSPHHILEDNPLDQKSRWLSDGTQSPQFIVLKLTRPSIVHSIKFGKYERSHQCNVRKLQVYAGMDIDKLHLVLDGDLENTSDAEVLSVQHCIEGQPFPSTHIKIVPLQGWGSGFNFSIWYVQLLGNTDKTVVDQAFSSYTAYREREALRLCLKHLRQNDYTEAFEALQKKARVTLEHPSLTQLHSHLVVQGNFQQCEEMVKKSVEDGVVDDYLENQPLKSVWNEVKPVSGRGGWPPTRGAHQLCFEESTQLLYLHGGWDGAKELGDLWTYSVIEGFWKCICQDTSLVGGPSPRSCHRLCLDKTTRTLYFLGQFIEISPDNSIPLSDFYCYQIDSHDWNKISSDTASDGGPQLIFNHQMCFSESTQSLYVFGGRVLTPNYLGEGTYSGLYVYLVARKEWLCLQPDFHPSSSYVHSLIPRMDHAMFISQSQKLLYVIGGERGNQALDDMMTYNILSDETVTLADGHEKHIPESGLIIQTCHDDNTQEILLLASLGRFQDVNSYSISQPRSSSPVPTWLYSIHSDKWLAVKQQGTGPCPRYAHQVAYDPCNKTYYMFGGHPGDSAKGHQSSMRLDDLWTMKLVRQDRGYLLRQCQLLIRQQRFSELSREDPAQAVSYLQNEVSQVVDHDNPSEREQFQKMTAQLFSSDIKPNRESVNLQRNAVYSKICRMFPSRMTQPSQNISDMVNIVAH